VLTGDKDFIRRARRVRKTFGGALRQAGYLAAAGIYALEHNIERLKRDHERARDLGVVLAKLPYVETVMPIDSNIIIFSLKGGKSASGFTRLLREHDIHAFPVSADSVRFVTHLNFTDEMLGLAMERLKKISF
jgi:threonine aldolase